MMPGPTSGNMASLSGSGRRRSLPTRILPLLSLWLPALLLACEPFSSPIWSDGTETVYDEDAPLLIEPAELAFGPAVVNDLTAPLTASVSVTNLSDQERLVYGHALVEGDGDVFWVGGPEESYFTLAAKERRTLDVSFAPLTAARYEGQFAFEGGTTPVTLSGQGLAPSIALSDDAPVAVPVGCEEGFTLTITNDGNRPLEVDALALEGGQDFSLPAPEAATGTVEPGQSLAVPVHAAPVFSWSRSHDLSDMLTVHSNDPLVPEARYEIDTDYIRGSVVEQSQAYYPGLEVDLLVVVDNTGTMATRVQKAEGALEVMVDTLLSAEVDLHAAVLTGASPCPAGEEAFVRSRFDSEQAITEHLIEGLYGPSGMHSGALLGLASAALVETDPRDCMDGFVREGALFHLVVISRQDDQSGLDVDDQISALRQQVSASRGLQISAMVGAESGGCMGLDYAPRYLQAAVLTDGVQASACASEWSPAFEEIALSSALAAEGGAVLALDQSPVEETIEVLVDGALYTEEWLYEPEPPSVRFFDEVAPDTGSTVLIRYILPQSCGETEDTGGGDDDGAGASD